MDIIHFKSYLEHRDGHYKFYEIKLIQRSNKLILETRFGRIGTKGRVSEIQNDTFTSQRQNSLIYEANSIVTSKQRKGYKIAVSHDIEEIPINREKREPKDLGRFGRLMLD